MSIDNQVVSNLFVQNESGIVLDAGADRNRLSGNTLQRNTTVDIQITGARQTLISSNFVDGSGTLGISIQQAEAVTVTANSVLSHTAGVRINANGGLFTGNIWRNNNTGLEVVGTSANKRLYNNLFSNSNNLTLVPLVGINIWNVERQDGPNLLGGPFIGGNFWGGPNPHNCQDAESDGLCDSTYELGGSNQDQLPLAALAGLADCAFGPQWTILVYLNGDNDLDLWTEQLFNRLEQVAGKIFFSNRCSLGSQSDRR